MAPGSGLRQDRHAHRGLDHPAGRLEIAHLNSLLERAMQLVAHLAQEGVNGAGLLQAHIVKVERVHKVNRRRTGQGVTPGQHQHQAVAAVGNGLQALGAHQAGHDADVGLALRDRADDVVRKAFAQVDIDIGVAQQVAAQDRWQVLPQGRRVGKHPQVSLDAPGVLLQIAPQVLDLAQHRAGMVHKGLARRRERDALAGAVEQLGADAFLQIFDARACRRQGDVRGLGAFGQAVGFGNTHHQAQVNEIKVHGHGGIIPPAQAHKKAASLPRALVTARAVPAAPRVHRPCGRPG